MPRTDSATPSIAKRSWKNVAPFIAADTDPTEHQMLQFLKSDPATCGKAILHYLYVIDGILGAALNGAIAESRGESRFPGSPGAESRGRVQDLVVVQAPALLQAALYLADDDALRHSLKLQLDPIQSMATALAKQLDGIPAERLYCREQKCVIRGPWTETYERLGERTWQARFGLAGITTVTRPEDGAGDNGEAK